MERIVIIGNSGSGKTYHWSNIEYHFHYRLIHLDALFWEPGGFNIKRPQELVYGEIDHLRQSQTSIVEGVFGELAKEYCASADTRFG
jgi:adenylate kinase family enzyme